MSSFPSLFSSTVCQQVKHSNEERNVIENVLVGQVTIQKPIGMDDMHVARRQPRLPLDICFHVLMVKLYVVSNPLYRTMEKIFYYIWWYKNYSTISYTEIFFRNLNSFDLIEILSFFENKIFENIWKCFWKINCFEIFWFLSLSFHLIIIIIKSDSLITNFFIFVHSLTLIDFSSSSFHEKKEGNWARKKKERERKRIIFCFQGEICFEEDGKWIFFQFFGSESKWK